jgi:hypothetical protein
MTTHCFKSKDSRSQPICGIHNVPLIEKTLPSELIAAGYKTFTFLVCPVTEEVIDDEQGHPGRA